MFDRYPSAPPAAPSRKIHQYPRRALDSGSARPTITKIGENEYGYENEDGDDTQEIGSEEEISDPEIGNFSDDDRYYNIFV